MRKTIYYVTKDKYDDAQRVLGFVKDFGVHIYYDFFSHKVQLTTKTDGSHFSYHEDGNVYRTSKGIGKEKICETIPVKKFSSYYDLCTTAFEKDTVNDLKPLKEKYKKDQQYHIIEIDLDKYSNNFINLVLDMIHVDFYDTFYKNPEAIPPHNADTFRKKLNSKIIVELTVLGDDNLIIEQNEDGFTPKHFNKRFSANEKKGNYYYEADTKDL
jgi:hypothetical protein